MAFSLLGYGLDLRCTVGPSCCQVEIDCCAQCGYAVQAADRADHTPHLKLVPPLQWVGTPAVFTVFQLPTGQAEYLAFEPSLLVCSPDHADPPRGPPAVGLS